MKRILVVAALTLLPLGGVVIAQGMNPGAGGMPAQQGMPMQMPNMQMPNMQMQGAQMTPPPGVNPDYARDLMAGMDKMMDGMHMMPTGNADRDFATMMIPHHQGAIDMAILEIKYGKDPELRALAARIIQAQDAEINQLRERLSKLPQ
jgi:uncharacterized protein (DUF305 family)